MMFVLHDVSISAAATTVKAFKLFIFFAVEVAFKVMSFG